MKALCLRCSKFRQCAHTGLTVLRHLPPPNVLLLLFALAWPAMLTVVTRFHGGCSGVESHYSLPLQREARQKLVTSDFRTNPTLRPTGNLCRSMSAVLTASRRIWGTYQFRTAATSFLLHFRTTQFGSHSQNPHLMVLRVGFVKPLLVISL